jgi:O-antigen/teichoic acid export membrane protein
VFASKILGLFGPEYAPHSALLVLGLLATFPDALINVAVAMLRVQRRLAAVAAISVAIATIAVALSWLLMPHLGIMGAGWAALISPTIVVTTLTGLWVHRSLTGARAGRSRAPAADEPAMEPS